MEKTLYGVVKAYLEEDENSFSKEETIGQTMYAINIRQKLVRLKDCIDQDWISHDSELITQVLGGEAQFQDVILTLKQEALSVQYPYLGPNRLKYSELYARELGQIRGVIPIPKNLSSSGFYQGNENLFVFPLLIGLVFYLLSVLSIFMYQLLDTHLPVVPTMMWLFSTLATLALSALKRRKITKNIKTMLKQAVFLDDVFLAIRWLDGTDTTKETQPTSHSVA